MNVVVASRFDPIADLVHGGELGETLVLTAADLSQPGWCYWAAADAEVNTAVVAGQRLEAAEIDGVITRLPSVSEPELDHIRAGDRAYVAAEMTAWLAAWLAGLPCPVLNRPSPVNLMGPLWSQDQWRWIARELDLDVAREVDAASIAAIVTVIGGRAVDAPHAGLAAAAAALADAAAVDLLRACFDRCDRLIGADYWVALEDRGVREAVLERIGA